jgi:hypothetical protein
LLIFFAASSKVYPADLRAQDSNSGVTFALIEAIPAVCPLTPVLYHILAADTCFSSARALAWIAVSCMLTWPIRLRSILEEKPLPMA